MIKQNSGTVSAALSAVFLSALFLMFPETVSDAAVNALSVCAARVVPSVFPFSVCSSMFLAAGGGELLDRAVSPLSRRVFGTDRGASALALGLVFGFPLGALTVGEECRSGEITKDEASRLLAFVCCASPTFPVFVVGRGFFGSTAAGLLIWGTQAAVSVVIGFLIARFPRKTRPTSRPAMAPHHAADEARDAPDFFTLVTHGVKNGAGVMLNVCGSVTFFSIVSSVITRLTESVTSAPVVKLFIPALFEFSSGTSAVAEAYSAGDIGRAAALSLCGFAIGFAGLSVMFQTASVCDGIPLLPHFAGKLLCGTVTAAVTYALAAAPAFAPVFSSGGTLTPDPAPLPPLTGLIPSAAVFIFTVCLTLKHIFRDAGADTSGAAGSKSDADADEKSSKGVAKTRRGDYNRTDKRYTENHAE